MENRINIFGASGSGTSTLGREVSSRLRSVFLDADSYYWKDTEPPYTEMNAPADRVSKIEQRIKGRDSWVLSGSICNWGGRLPERFTLAIFLYLEPEIRLSRLAQRERARFGSRIDRGGDMYETHLKFLEWAREYDAAGPPTRSLALHESWIEQLTCPVLRLDARKTIGELADAVVGHCHVNGHCKSAS